MDALVLILGVALLAAGAELLIRGASALAAAARISPLVIGLTVVAFGTSMPELVVSLQSALRGQTDIALGNVIGSNVLNVLLILGISALAVPLVVSQRMVWREVPLMIALSLLLFVLVLDGVLSRADGAVLVCGLVLYLAWSVIRRRELTGMEDLVRLPANAPWRSLYGLLLQVALAGAGLVLLVLGAGWFTDAAVRIARSVGVSELVIGMTVVALGTSLPEGATSVLAALRGQRDIAVGNAIGSNIFNILGVLGVSSLLAPGGLAVAPAVLYVDLPIMIAVAIACLPIFFTGHAIARWEGGLFLVYYAAYTTYLVLAATDEAVLQRFEIAMLGFAVPLTVITLAIGVFRAAGLMQPQVPAR